MEKKTLSPFIWVFLVIDLFLVIFLLLLLTKSNLILPFFLPSPPKKQAVSKPRPQATREVLLVSDMATLSAQIANLPLLKSYLDQFGFWEEGKVAVVDPQTYKIGFVTPEKLVIRLTSQTQPMEQVMDSKTRIVRQSWGDSFQDGELSLYLYVSPQILEEISAEEKAKIFERLLLRALFSATHRQPEVKDQERLSQATEIIRNFVSQNQRLLTVSSR